MAYAVSTLCQRLHILPNIFPRPTDIPAIIWVLLSRKSVSDFNLIHVCVLFRIVHLLQPLFIDSIYQNVLSVTFSLPFATTSFVVSSSERSNIQYAWMSSPILMLSICVMSRYCWFQRLHSVTNTWISMEYWQMITDSVRPQNAEKSLSQCHFVHPKYHTAYLGGPNLSLIYYCVTYYITFIISYLL